jgi:hypothetical protein
MACCSFRMFSVWFPHLFVFVRLCPYLFCIVSALFPHVCFWHLFPYFKLFNVCLADLCMYFKGVCMCSVFVPYVFRIFPELLPYLCCIFIRMCVRIVSVCFLFFVRICSVCFPYVVRICFVCVPYLFRMYNVFYMFSVFSFCICSVFVSHFLLICVSPCVEGRYVLQV